MIQPAVGETHVKDALGAASVERGELAGIFTRGEVELVVGGDERAGVDGAHVAGEGAVVEETVGGVEGGEDGGGVEEAAEVLGGAGIGAGGARAGQGGGGGRDEGGVVVGCDGAAGPGRWAHTKEGPDPGGKHGGVGAGGGEMGR